MDVPVEYSTFFVAEDFDYWVSLEVVYYTWFVSSGMLGKILVSAIRYIFVSYQVSDVLRRYLEQIR